MSDILEALKRAVESDEERKVIRSIPMRPQWAVRMEEMMALADDLKCMHEKRDRLKKRFWIMIEDDLGEYGIMRYNHDEGCIELLEDDD